MTIRRFHVFGQRCSGTNALIHLVEQNFPDLTYCEAAGFKHWFVPRDQELSSDTVVIVIARDVSDWLRSLFRKPWHAHPSLKQLGFSDFIRAEWRSIWDADFWGVDEGDERFGKPIQEELCPKTNRPFANAIAKRTAKLENWLALEDRAARFLPVGHHDLVARPEHILMQLANLTKSQPRSSFQPVRSYKGQDEQTFRPKVYTPLNDDDYAFAMANVRPEIEAVFGLAYEPRMRPL